MQLTPITDLQPEIYPIVDEKGWISNKVSCFGEILDFATVTPYYSEKDKAFIKTVEIPLYTPFSQSAQLVADLYEEFGMLQASIDSSDWLSEMGLSNICDSSYIDNNIFVTFDLSRDFSNQAAPIFKETFGKNYENPIISVTPDFIHYFSKAKEHEDVMVKRRKEERLADDIRHLLYNLYLELYTEPTDAENEEITYGRVGEFYAYLGYNLESEDLLQQLNIQSTSDLMTLLETF